MDEIWSVILEDRIARRSKSTSLSYFVKMRDSTNHIGNRKFEAAFLTPGLLEERLSRPIEPPKSSPTRINGRSKLSSASPSSDRVSPCSPISPIPITKLPINLSTLVPLPRQDMRQQDPTSMAPASVLNGNILNLPKKNGQNFDVPAKRRIPIISWPGIDAITESYKNYAKGMKISNFQLTL